MCLFAQTVQVPFPVLRRSVNGRRDEASNNMSGCNQTISSMGRLSMRRQSSPCHMHAMTSGSGRQAFGASHPCCPYKHINQGHTRALLLANAPQLSPQTINKSGTVPMQHGIDVRTNIRRLSWQNIQWPCAKVITEQLTEPNAIQMDLCICMLGTTRTSSRIEGLVLHKLDFAIQDDMQRGSAISVCM